MVGDDGYRVGNRIGTGVTKIPDYFLYFSGAPGVCEKCASAKRSREEGGGYERGIVVAVGVYKSFREELSPD